MMKIAPLRFQQVRSSENEMSLSKFGGFTNLISSRETLPESTVHDMDNLLEIELDDDIIQEFSPIQTTFVFIRHRNSTFHWRRRIHEKSGTRQF